MSQEMKVSTLKQRKQNEIDWLRTSNISPNPEKLREAEILENLDLLAANFEQPNFRWVSLRSLACSQCGKYTDILLHPTWTSDDPYEGIRSICEECLTQALEFLRSHKPK